MINLRQPITFRLKPSHEQAYLEQCQLLGICLMPGDLHSSNAEYALARLFKESSAAKEQLERAAGYAVFDTRKFSFLITTGAGSGVAVDNASNKRTYMKMATGGLNIGGGVKFYQVIFLFPDKATLNDFVESGWSADSDAAAESGKEGAYVGIKLKNGVIVHSLSDKGLVLAVSLTGTKYWKDADLNWRESVCDCCTEPTKYAQWMET